jgi:WD40 repeat protein
MLTLYICPPPSLNTPETFLWSGSSDKTVKIWNIANASCVRTMTITADGLGVGHTDLVSCLCLIPAMNGAEAYMASGDTRGDVKLWNAGNGELVMGLTHSQFVSEMMCFQDATVGQPLLIIGLKNAGFVMRSCATMAILFVISPSAVGIGNSVQAFANLGLGCFASAGDDGNVAVWRIAIPIVEPQQQQQQPQQQQLLL